MAFLLFLCVAMPFLIIPVSLAFSWFIYWAKDEHDLESLNPKIWLVPLSAASLLQMLIIAAIVYYPTPYLTNTTTSNRIIAFFIVSSVVSTLVYIFLRYIVKNNWRINWLAFFSNSLGFPLFDIVLLIVAGIP
jgi:hypothetical protein